MMLEAPVIEEIAERMLQAQDGGQPVAPPTGDYPQMGADDGYAVQGALRRRWVERGERITGMKVGVAPRTGAESSADVVPYFALLSNVMACPENGVVDTVHLIQPRVDAGLGFLLASALDNAACTPEEVVRATECILPALEISTLRYASAECDLASLIAANGGLARYVTGGRPLQARGRDLRTLGLVVERNAEVVALGAGAAAHGHPANAVAQLVQHLAASGEALAAGSLVLVGGITPPIAVEKGDVLTARFQDMGSISLRFG